MKRFSLQIKLTLSTSILQQLRSSAKCELKSNRSEHDKNCWRKQPPNCREQNYSYYPANFTAELSIGREKREESFFFIASKQTRFKRTSVFSVNYLLFLRKTTELTSNNSKQAQGSCMSMTRTSKAKIFDKVAFELSQRKFAIEARVKRQKYLS